MGKLLYGIFFLSLVGIDILGKWFFGGYLQSKLFDCFPIDIQNECISRYIPIFGEYVGISAHENAGIAFSLPIEGVFLKVITILIIGFLLYHYWSEERIKQSHFIDIGYTMIFAGASVHAYERIFIGHVVDFISVKYFAILNFADIFISVGFFLIILDYVRNRRKYR